MQQSQAFSNRSCEHYDWDVFVSHNRCEKPWVRKAVKQWRDNGLKVFFDEDSIEPGVVVVDAITDGIERSRLVVLLLSRASLESRWVAREVALAQTAGVASEDRRLIPVLLEDIPDDEIKLSIRSLHFVRLSDRRTREDEYRRLLTSFRIPRPELISLPPLDTPDENEPTANGLQSRTGCNHSNDQTNVAVGTGTVSIEIVLDGDLDSFSDYQQERLLRAIGDLLGTSDDVRIRRIRRGSIRVTIDLPPDQAERLQWAIRRGELDHLGVRSISPPMDTRRSSTSAANHPHTPVANATWPHDPSGRAAHLPLSREARRVRRGLGLPITAVPGVEREERTYLRDYSVALNRVLKGEGLMSGIWNFLMEHLPAPAFKAMLAGTRMSFSSLWDREELMLLVDKNLRDLEMEWRRRVNGHPRWTAAAQIIQTGVDYAAIWRDILGGDFDLRGRGAEYTKGMESFYASRWLGVRILLDLLGARNRKRSIFLDVLGGDGYVWRLLEAEKEVMDTCLVIVEDEHLYFEEGSEVPIPLRELTRRLTAIDARATVLAVRAASGFSGKEEHAGEMRYRARLLAAPTGDLAISREILLSDRVLQGFLNSGEAVWLVATDSHSAAPIADRAEAFVAARREIDGGALIVTNDISPHMFYRAGLWGLPTREDATQLSRTFLPNSFDGVLFAYGTHHVPDMFDATREACAVMKPGATVVVHDFFDEGPAGQWFHHVVDKHSKTGHDIPHIGPVQMAVVLFAAGFQDVELHETQDPFFFASDGEGVKAKDLALSYLLGMYGMEESFRGRLEEFEQIVKTVLTYPEVGETPIFTDDFVYIPRRAVVARARKPESGAAPRYSEADRVLIAGITELFRQEPGEILRRANTTEEVGQYWFGKDGSRWGISPERQRAWLDWAHSAL